MTLKTWANADLFGTTKSSNTAWPFWFGHGDIDLAARSKSQNHRFDPFGLTAIREIEYAPHIDEATISEASIQSYKAESSRHWHLIIANLYSAISGHVTYSHFAKCFRYFCMLRNSMPYTS